MAIAFSCDCGKQLRAREQFAGRRMKCPECAKVLTIPPAGEPPLAEAAISDLPAPPQPVASHTPSSEPDWFATAVAEVAVVNEVEVTIADNVGGTAAVDQVGPGKSQFKDGDEFDTIQPRAEEFAAEVARPPDDALPLPQSHMPCPMPPRIARPSVKTPDVSHSWQDRSLQQKSTPWRLGDRERFQPGPESRERSFRWLKVALLLLIVAGGIAGLNAMPTPAERAAAWAVYSDLDLVPDESAVMLAVRLGDMWLEPSNKTLRGSLPRLTIWLDENLDIKPEAVERVTLILYQAKDPSFLFKGMKGDFDKGDFFKNKAGFGGKKAEGQKQIPAGGGKGAFNMGGLGKGGPGKGGPGKGGFGKGGFGKGGFGKGGFVPQEKPEQPKPDMDFFDTFFMKRHLLIVRTRDTIDFAAFYPLVDAKHLFRHKDRTLVRLRKSMLPGACLAVINSKTLVIGAKPDIERALDDLDRPRHGNLKTAIARAQDKHVVLAISESQPLSRALPPFTVSYLKRLVPPATHALLEIREGLLTLHENEAGLVADAHLSFADKKAADTLAQAIPATFNSDPAAWTRFVAAAPSHFRPLLRQISASAGNMRTQQRDTELDVSLTTTNRPKDTP